MKITYWKIQNQIADETYSIRARTKEDAIEQLIGNDLIGDYRDPETGIITVEKITIEYIDAIDLIRACYSTGNETPVKKIRLNI
jgi:hypothetical protein